ASSAMRDGGRPLRPTHEPAIPHRNAMVTNFVHHAAIDLIVHRTIAFEAHGETVQWNGSRPRRIPGGAPVRPPRGAPQRHRAATVRARPTARREPRRLLLGRSRPSS